MKDKIFIGSNGPCDDPNYIHISPIVTVCVWLYSNLSEDDIMYAYFPDSEFLPSVYIYKNSDEGRELTEWVKDSENQNDTAVHNKMLQILCNSLPREDLYDLMIIIKNQANFEGYKRGKLEIRNGIKTLLDIHN